MGQLHGAAIDFEPYFLPVQLRDGFHCGARIKRGFRILPRIRRRFLFLLRRWGRNRGAGFLLKSSVASLAIGLQAYEPRLSEMVIGRPLRVAHSRDEFGHYPVSPFAGFWFRRKRTFV